MRATRLHTRRGAGRLLVLSIMAAMAWQGVDGMCARDASQRQLERRCACRPCWRSGRLTCRGAGHRRRAAAGVRRRDPCVMTRHARRRAGGGLVAQARIERQRPAPLGRRSVTTGAALQDSWFASQQLMGSEPGQLRRRRRVAVAGLLLPGQRPGNAQSTGNVAAPPAGAASGASGSGAPSACAWCSIFAPGSGVGTLTRDIMLGP